MQLRLATTLLASLIVTSATPVAAKGPTHVWHKLHSHEQQAFRHYERHVSNGEVRRNGEQLFELAQSEDFKIRPKTCGAAARTLAYMVSGYYASVRRAEISRDWHHYSDAYADQRAACLSELEIDERSYPLPWWFGW